MEAFGRAVLRFATRLQNGARIASMQLWMNHEAQLYYAELPLTWWEEADIWCRGFAAGWREAPGVEPAIFAR